MKIATTIEARTGARKQQGSTVGLVPTMGYLHATRQSGSNVRSSATAR